MNITEKMINSFAPDLASVKNARKLSDDKDFLNHGQTEDGKLFFGVCKGSGKKDYSVSIDFADEANPVFSCNCPSRKLPCKHSLGLLIEMEKGQAFEILEIPEIIQKKRAKREAAKAKKATNSTKPKRINKAARLKKMQKQLEGLEVAQKIVDEILEQGLQNFASQPQTYYKSFGKELGNYYLSGVQKYFFELIDACNEIPKPVGGKPVGIEYYYPAIKILTKMNSLIEKSTEYLTECISTENVEHQDTSLYESLGGAWKLEELKDLGLTKENTELAQLTIYTTFSKAQNMYTDVGYWIDLETGAINPTYNYRPARAKNHIKEEDSEFDIVKPTPLTYYPGEQNQRIRWDEKETRELVIEDINKICKFATDVETAIKNAKNYLKNTLSNDTFPVLIEFEMIGLAGKNHYVLQDKIGNQVDVINSEDEISAIDKLHNKLFYENQILFGEMSFDEVKQRFKVYPASIITQEQIIRIRH